MKGFLGSSGATMGKGSTAVDTLIGRNTEILGDVRFSGGLHVDGRIKGAVSVAADASGTLSVAESGAIEGNIRVPNVILNGNVVGDVHASESLTLNAKARVSGDVHYKVLQIEPGATINGQLVHDGGEAAGFAAKARSTVHEIAEARSGKSV